MLRAIFFDMGGTLDGDGLHWLDRFVALYQSLGVDLPRETMRAAFDEAERRSALDETIASSNFRGMIERYVKWQLAHLRLENRDLEQDLVAGFIKPVRTAAVANVKLLAGLAQSGFELGVVSNGCGNVASLCTDFGYAPFLSVVVDSRRIGICKPDPAIFLHAAKKIGRDPGEIMMVGDSFDRDVRPAKEIGMKTAWLEGAGARPCPDPSLVDLRLRRLADLPAALSTRSPNFALRAGVLAAGRGERLRSSNLLKPLVKVGERTLIERVLASMAEAGAAEVTVIINEDSLAVRDHVVASDWPFVLRWIVETTPSSMHSFLRLIETLAADGNQGPFLLSTVDTVASSQTFSRFIDEARSNEDAAITLALTSPGNDEKPLLVRCAEGDSRIVAIGAAAAPSDLATAGLYAVRASILREADEARRDGVDALRTFLGRLLDRGYHLAGIRIAESIDVDRPADIGTAEAFLRSAVV